MQSLFVFVAMKTLGQQRQDQNTASSKIRSATYSTRRETARGAQEPASAEFAPLGCETANRIQGTQQSKAPDQNPRTRDLTCSIEARTEVAQPSPLLDQRVQQ